VDDKRHSPKKTIPTNIVNAALDIWQQTDQLNEISVAGRSMLPFFQPGDQVMITHNQNNIKRGDVIVFRQNGKLTIHRVIYRKENQFITKGDNVSHYDLPVPSEQVLGRVFKVKRENQEYRIDTIRWQITGQLVVGFTLSWKFIYGLFSKGKQRLFGQAANPITTFLRQTAFRIFSFLRVVLQRILS